MLEPRRLLAPLLLKDIPTGTRPSFPSDIFTLGTKHFFTADDGVHGKEIWTTDGTADGTQMFLDLSPGSASSNPDLHDLVNGLIYFDANDGTHNGLWRTHGTPYV